MKEIFLSRGIVRLIARMLRSQMKIGNKADVCLYTELNQWLNATNNQETKI